MRDVGLAGEPRTLVRGDASSTHLVSQPDETQIKANVEVPLQSVGTGYPKYVSGFGTEAGANLEEQNLTQNLCNLSEKSLTGDACFSCFLSIGYGILNDAF